MILLQAHRISKSYGVQPILSNIQLEIRSGERVGLVGVNGAGKSTLLKILIGELSYTEGEVMRTKDTSLGYLAQNSGLETEATIWEEMQKPFASLLAQEKQLRKMEQQMAHPDTFSNENEYQRLLEDYSRQSEDFKDRGGYQYEAMIRNVLHGLRFADKNYHDPIYSLSGGQKTRLALAKLLLQQPDILMLDEPTNYLDLETLTWLEQYLLSYPGGLLIVSHDRYFLDALVNVIYEIERTKALKYHGNYSHFLKQKAEKYEQELKQFTKQQQEIEKLEDFIARNLARASTSKRAQSRRRALEKIERLDRPQGDLKTTSFSFDIHRQSGNDVLKVEQVSLGFPQQDVPLAQNISFQAFRGDSIAIVGPNGVGKTTLLKTILGEIKPLSGSIQKGTNVSISYYDQEQNKLRSTKTVLQEIWDDYPNMLEKEVRGLLGQFLFSGEDVDKRVADLSGGEKARLSLAKLILQKANVLILDEPTNHLDIYSKEVLEEALIDYPGTILYVSHDRYFLNRISTKIMELSPQGVQTYLGDYDYYLQKKKELEEIKQLERGNQAQQVVTGQSETPEERRNKDTYEQEKERKKRERQREWKQVEIEQKMEVLEQQVQKWEEELCLPDVYQDYQKTEEIQQKIDQTKLEVEQLFEKWSRVAVE